MISQAIKVQGGVKIYQQRELDKSETVRKQYEGTVMNVIHEQYVRIRLNDQEDLTDISLDGIYHISVTEMVNNYKCQARAIERYESEQGKIVLFFILSTILEEER